MQYVARLMVSLETKTNVLVVYKKWKRVTIFADIILKLWLKREQVTA